MFEILTLVIFGWLVWKAFGLFFKITWGLAKIIAALLLVFAFPVLFVCIAFIGGVALLLPILLIGGAVGILKACV